MKTGTIRGRSAQTKAAKQTAKRLTNKGNTADNLDIMDFIGELPAATLRKDERTIELDVDTPEMAQQIVENIKQKLGRAAGLMKVTSIGATVKITAAPMAAKFLKNGRNNITDFLPIKVE